MWPQRIELRPSRYPQGLRAAAALSAWWSLALSDMPMALLALAGVLCCAGLYRWWPASPSVVLVAPHQLAVTVEGRQWTAEAPFRALLRPRWLALHCPGRGWVWVFPDQASQADLTPLRQVLLLQRA